MPIRLHAQFTVYIRNKEQGDDVLQAMDKF